MCDNRDSVLKVMGDVLFDGCYFVVCGFSFLFQVFFMVILLNYEELDCQKVYMFN